MYYYFSCREHVVVSDMVMSMQVLLLVNVTDGDEPNTPNSQITLTLDNDFGGLFAVQGQTIISNMSLAGQLGQYSIVIVAEDSGIPQQSTFAMFTIEIVNNTVYQQIINNQNGPTFELNMYAAVVSEDSTVGSTVITVSASSTDNRTAEYGFVQYIDCDNSMEFSTLITENEVNFTIDSSTGEITLDSDMLDAEHANPNITLCVVAYSSADPTVITDYARVVVIPIDVNEHDPFFTTTCQRFTINETTPVGTIVYNVVGNDSDHNPDIHYIINANYLSIHNNGSIYLNISLDLRNPTGLLSGAICGGSSLRCLTYSVTLHDQDPTLSTARHVSCFSVATIIDVDNYPPVFTSNLFEGTIYENANVGDVIKTVLVDGTIGTADLRTTANDPDVGYILEYSLEDSTFTTFEFDNDINNIISLAEPLDYETTMEYTFGIVVRDTGGRNDTSMVHVTVLDADDNTPEFQQAAYNISVVEESSLTLSIGMVSATDNDSGENQMLTYSIASAVPAGYFTINGQTGAIIIQQRVDREEYSQHELEVIAIDQGTPALTGTTMVTITLIDINDNPPEFTQGQYFGRVSENSTVGTPVMNMDNEQQLQLTANDDDIGENAEFIYQLVAPSPFAIDNMTGVVSVNGQLDFEETMQIQFQVIAVDTNLQSMRSDIVTVTVNIVNADDHIPVFTQVMYSFEANENLGRGVEINHVSATDRDAVQSVITYRIDSGNDDGKFQLGTTSGILSLIETLDREQVAAYNLTIAASSNGFVTSGTVQVTVTVLDDNDNAPIFSPASYTFNVNESGPNFSTGTVSASDADAGTNAAIVLTLSGDGETFFNIDRFSGEITTSMTVNFETNPTITFTVTATDGGSPAMSSMATVTVVVMDVNDNVPQFFWDSYGVTVDEYSPNGTLIVIVDATDVDSGDNGEVQYFISEVTPPGNFFYLDPTSGELEVNVEMLPSISQNSMYTLHIGAHDMGTTPRTGMVTANIRVIDINEPPAFTQDTYDLMIRENDEDFTYTLVATDPDTYRNYTTIVYSIPSVDGTTGSGDGSHLKVDETTGVLSINISFNFEEERNVGIMVEASDPNFPTLSHATNVSVQVIDVNDNAPRFNQTSYTVIASENAAINSVITDEIAAYDVDMVSRGMLQFAIDSGVPDRSKFEINPTTGVITLFSPLNATAAQTYTLAVSVTDGMLSSQAMVTITITDVNNHVPVFTQHTYTTSISESASTDDQIITVRAIDGDLGDFGTVEYSIVTVQNTFIICEDTGNITLNQSLDYEMTPTYTLKVRATDGGGMYGEANVIVNIMDENDNLPVFDMAMYNFDVLEGVQRLHIAGRVMADDTDSGLFGEVVYSISDTDNDTLPFIINQDTGDIVVNKSLDYEIDPYYLFEVEAMDRGDGVNSATVMVNVSVVDENDNIPMFNRSLYTIRVREDVDIYSTIFTASASDRDSGENSRLIYTITDSIPVICDSIYNIEPASGIVANVLQLDADNFNNGSQCLLVIQARDGGTPVYSVTALFQVNVDNVNEHSPMFIGDSTASFAENVTPGTVVFTVTAQDSDNVLNPNDVEYTINDTTNFEINSSTGVITVAVGAMIDRDAPGGETTTFTVTATDRGIPPLSTDHIYI